MQDKHRRLFRAYVATAAVAAVALAGCSSSAAGSTPSGGAAPAGPVASVRKMLPADILKSGTLTVGTRQDSPPNDFKDASGAEVGWEIDMMNAMAKVMGVSVKWNYSSFDALIPALQAKRYDFAFGAMGTRKERQAIIDFVSWVSSGGSFVTAASSKSPAITAMDDLCGKKVAVAGGSGDEAIAQAQSKTCVTDGKSTIDLQTYKTADEAYLSVTSGRSQIFYGETTNVGYLVKESKGKAVISGHDVYPTALGIGFLKGNTQLEKAVVAAVQELIDDGTYTQILGKWGVQSAALKTPELNPTPTR